MQLASVNINIYANNQIPPAFETNNAINIVFCPDNQYIKYFSILLQSIIDNANPAKKYDLLVFETEFSDYNKKLLLRMLPSNFSLRFINITEYINENFGNLEFYSKKYWSIATYYRLFIPFIMQKYKKVLYLDSDMCVNNNIDELFNTNFEDKNIIAVSDTVSSILSYKIDRKNYMQEILNLKHPESYFNAGLVLFNLENIKIEEYKTSLLKAFNIPNLWFCDQDILNIIFEGKTKLIHNKWNFMLDGLRNKNFLHQIVGDYRKNYIEAKENPCIIHYSGKLKPWNKPNIEYSDVFWKYARKTPFYEEIIFSNIEKAKSKKNGIKYKPLEYIISLRNQKAHKILTILGLKFKFKRKNIN